MSVMDIEPTIFGKIAATLLVSYNANQYAHCVFDYHEETAFRSLWMNTEPAAFEQRFRQTKERMILAWVNRLYLANQIAVALNYDNGEAFTLHNLPDGVQNAFPDTAKELYENLNQIKYNIYTNAGRCMFSHNDMQRLDNLISRAANTIIENRR